MDVRRIVEKVLGAAGVPEFFHDERERLRPDLVKIDFARERHGVGESLERRRERGMDAAVIAPGVDPVPAEPGKPDGVQPVQPVGRAVAGPAQPLITKPGMDAVRAEERGEQVAFGETETAAGPERLGGRDGDAGEPVIARVTHLVADEFEAAPGDFRRFAETVAQRLRAGAALGMVPVDDRAWT